MEAGDVDGAKETATMISMNNDNASGEQACTAYIAIAVAEAKAGDMAGARRAFDQAKEAASQIPNGDYRDDYRSRAYMQIACDQAENGNLADAIESIANIGKIEQWSWGRLRFAAEPEKLSEGSFHSIFDMYRTANRPGTVSFF